MGIKLLGYIFLVIITLLLTFFGLGPVVFADGSTGERILTFMVVLMGYIVTAYLFLRWRRRYTGR